MEEVQDAVQDWLTQGKELASRLRERLTELDSERTRIITQIERLEGKPNGSIKKQNWKRGAERTKTGRRGQRSALGLAILQVIKESGDEGLSCGEIIEQLESELDTVQRGQVQTQLSRMKKNGVIEAQGARRLSKYVFIGERQHEPQEP
jgi:hypothetical protein